MANNIEVKVTADVSELLKQFGLSEKSASDSAKSISESWEKTRAAFEKGLSAATIEDAGKRASQIFIETRTSAEKLQSNMSELDALFKLGAIDADTFARATDKVRGAMREADSEGSALTTGLKSLAATMAAGLSVQMFTSAIQGSVDMADNLKDLSAKTGATVETLAGLSLAAGNSGTSLDSVAVGVKFLSANIASGKGDLESLGIATKDPTQAMVQLADVFAGIESPADKSALAVKLFGKAGTEMLPMLADGSAALQEMIDAGTKYSNITTDMAAQSDGFNDRMGNMRAQMQGNFAVISGQMLPALNGLLDAFMSDSGGADSLRTAGDALVVTLRALVTAGVTTQAIFADVGDAIYHAGAAAAAAATGDFKQASAEIDAIGANHEKRMNELGAKLSKVWTDATADGGGDKKTNSVEIQRSIRDIVSKPEKQGNGSDAEARKAEREAEQAKRMAERVAQIELEAGKARQIAEIGVEEELLARKKALGEVSGLDAIKQAQDLANRRYEIELQSAKALEAMHVGKADALAQDKAKQAAIEAKHSADLIKLETATQVELKKQKDKAAADDLKRQNETWKPIDDAMQKSIKGYLDGTMTAHGAIAASWQALGGMVSSALAKIVQDEITANIQSLISSKTKAMGEVTVAAGSAAAKAAESQASIPVAGPALAAGAFASTMGLVLGALGIVSSVPSAAGGFDIPVGVNPLTQLHEQEMVLPKEDANTMRALRGLHLSAPQIPQVPQASMSHSVAVPSGGAVPALNGAASFAAKNGQGGQKSAQSPVINITATDVHSFGQMMRSNPNALTDAFNHSSRLFNK